MIILSQFKFRFVKVLIIKQKEGLKMTKETLDRANEIKKREKIVSDRLNVIKDINNYLIESPFVLKADDRGYVEIPSNLKDTILLLVEAEYKKELEKLEKEFNEL